ncbi:Thiamine import ATP-binding protein ThiQ [Ascidiaceihabitans donghaensis]|uniref:Thiamine import ATP-binding protein ThiQ n=1 Tax=Ascidiaceihabitans donghaensis TaxID=1510460 RepID=A0A2R8B937_9RHOB|nr:ATP-binding cassette domain-containing protein [Ascidiaceihabitans donghaensis]SPH19557.1 Thiamine import ATP-binding protein ThiQ [Ascidiaceihabitans donghaensis]
MLSLNNVLMCQGAFSLRADLMIEAGCKVAVIGPSGAGKSTLVNAICGFVDVAEGQVQLDGRDITQALPSKRHMAILFQDNNLFPHLSIAQNVGLGIRPAMRLSQAETAQISVALDRVGLEGFEDRKPAALSGGQQSRAALARALVQGKPWMVLDEPFAALGPALRAEMLDLVASVAMETGAGVLMVTHSPDDARRLADQVIFVADGVANPPVATAELLDNPPSALKAYLG